MRPLKFRAWDGKKMCFPSVYEFGINGVNGLPSIAFQLPDGGYCTSANIMQFTGLLDRQGQEIYEEDVVAIEAEDGRTNKLVVRFGIARREMKSGWMVDIPSFYFDLIGGDFKAFPIVKNYKGVHDLSIMEILGNIYEHPHLVEPT